MPQLTLPLTLKDVASELAHWHFLPAAMGLMAITYSKLHPQKQVPAQVERLPESPRTEHESWLRADGEAYMQRVQEAWAKVDHAAIERLGLALRRCWLERRQVFICGNGGSAANAVHLANDLLYGIDKPRGMGMRVQALTANTSILSCLGNDTDYSEIFSRQLRVLADPGDLLIVFSGSGNSGNIVEVLKEARKLGVESHGILGYTGGRSLSLADNPIHFAVEDMQVSEDLQIMVGHMLSQWLLANPVHPPCQPQS